MRQPPRRVILPNGELKRFRLPDGIGDESAELGGFRSRMRRTSTAMQSAAWMRGPGTTIGVAWGGLVVGCWLIVQSPPNLAQLWSTPLTDEINWYSNVGVARAAIQLGAGVPFEATPVANHAQAETPAKAIVHVAAPVAVASRGEPRSAPAQVRSALPPVDYPRLAMHQGALASNRAFVQERGPAAVAATLPERLTGALTRNKRQQINDARVVSKPDPFEEDFERSIARNAAGPRSAARHESDRPVKLGQIRTGPIMAPVPSDEASGSSRRSAVKHVPGRGSPSGNAARPVVSHGGRGCEAVYDASQQQVDVSQRPARDVSSTQYAAVINRLDALRCGPKRPTEVSICAAVADGRAVGVTVSTTPGDSDFGGCLVRQVQQLTFPSGQGVDLVRSSLAID